jgi:transposase
MDNHATHKTPAIREWFARRPRWHVHFTPTGASRLNLVERFFAEITERQIRRGVHTSVRQLEEEVDTQIARRKDDPTPFTWMRTADEILKAIRRFCLRIRPPPCLLARW